MIANQVATIANAPKAAAPALYLFARIRQVTPSRVQGPAVNPSPGCNPPAFDWISDRFGTGNTCVAHLATGRLAGRLRSTHTFAERKGSPRRLHALAAASNRPGWSVRAGRLGLWWTGRGGGAPVRAPTAAHLVILIVRLTVRLLPAASTATTVIFAVERRPRPRPCLTALIVVLVKRSRIVTF